MEQVIFTSLDGPKKEAKRLFKLLKKHNPNTKLKLSVMQDAIASRYGWQSWNAMFIAHSKDNLPEGEFWCELRTGQQLKMLEQGAQLIGALFVQDGFDEDAAEMHVTQFFMPVIEKHLMAMLPYKLTKDDLILALDKVTPESWTDQIWQTGVRIHSPSNDYSKLVKFYQQYVCKALAKSGGIVVVHRDAAQTFIDNLPVCRVVGGPISNPGCTTLTLDINIRNLTLYLSGFIKQRLESIGDSGDVWFWRILSITGNYIRYLDSRFKGDWFEQNLDEWLINKNSLPLLAKCAADENVDFQHRAGLVKFLDECMPGMSTNEWRTGEFKINAVEHFAYFAMVIEEAIEWLFSHINKNTQNGISIAEQYKSDVPMVIVYEDEQSSYAPLAAQLSVLHDQMLTQYTTLKGQKGKVRPMQGTKLLVLGHQFPLFVKGLFQFGSGIGRTVGWSTVVSGEKQVFVDEIESAASESWMDTHVLLRKDVQVQTKFFDEVALILR